jgi:MoaA/NifB/PqqE/SkfB family radical SAM enzyme
MSFISSDKLLFHAHFDNKPITADIFLTNYCNNHCPYCTYGRWDLESNNMVKYMSFEEFKKYTSRLLDLGVKGIILTGGGEPTIDKDFDKITEWLENNNIEYGVNSNFNVLKYFKPKYLKVSLDAYDDASYKAYRGVEAYSKVKQNIIMYDKWRKENNVENNLGIQMVASNVETVNKFYSANKDLPVDYISIRPMESTGGSYYLKDMSDDFKPAPIISAIKTLSMIDKRVQINYKWDMLNWVPNECHAQWATIALNMFGEVMYCCHKPYEIVGHIMDDDILEKKKRYVTDMSKCDSPCRLSAPNKVLSILKEPAQHMNFI